MDLLQRVREKLSGCGANPTEDDLRWAMQEVGLEMAEESCSQPKKLKRSGAEVQREAAYQQGQQQEKSSSPCRLETHLAQAEYNWPLGGEQTELFATEIKAETPQRLPVSLTQPDVMPDVTQDHLVHRDWYRHNLWWETLRLEQELDGKFVPSLEEKFWIHFDLRLPYLGEMPQEEWEEELHDLVEMEMGLDESYRALAWYATELCPWLKNGNPTEGYDYNGPGLMFEGMRDDPSFGSSAEMRRQIIQEMRELYLPVSLGLREDLDYLTLQEWELEQAYNKLFDLARQYAPGPVGTQELFHHAKLMAPLQKQVETEDLMDFWGEAVLPQPLSRTPTTDLGAMNLCSLHVGNSRPKEEGPSFMQVAFQELGLNAVELCLATASASEIQEGETRLPQPPAEEPVTEQSTPDLGPMSREETALNKELKSLTIPAEARASGQRTFSLCPTPPVTLDCLVGETCENSPQQLSLSEHPAEKPTERQKTDFLCSVPTPVPNHIGPADSLEEASPTFNPPAETQTLNLCSSPHTLQLENENPMVSVMTSQAGELALGQNVKGLGTQPVSQRWKESTSEYGTFQTYSGTDQVEVCCLGSLSPRGKNCDEMAIPLATLGTLFPMLLTCSCA